MHDNDPHKPASQNHIIYCLNAYPLLEVQQFSFLWLLVWSVCTQHEIRCPHQLSTRSPIAMATHTWMPSLLSLVYVNRQQVVARAA